MKRRMAFLLALVMALALAIGVMPAAADEQQPVYNTYVGHSFTVTLSENETARVKQGYADLLNGPIGKNTFIANYSGKAYIEILESGHVVRTVEVNISANSSGWETITSTDFTLSSTYTGNNIFPTERFTVNVTAQRSGSTISANKYTYNWSVSGENVGAELVSASGGSATFVVTQGSDQKGKPGRLLITCTITGVDGQKTITNWTLRKRGAEMYSEKDDDKVDVYGGTAKVIYYDSKTKQQIAAGSLQTTNTSGTGTLARRTYLSSGTSVGYTTGKVIDYAKPSVLNFDPNTSLIYENVEIYVRDATAWDNRPTQPDYGSMGYVVLNQYYANNPYVIMVGIEAMNNLKAMNVGGTQQITADMLGGVPVNAPGMSYKVADESIADVTQDGLVRAKKAGMTMLRVFCGDHEVINKQIFVLGSGTAFEDDPIIDEDGLYFGITSVTRSLEEKGDVRFRVSAKNLSVDGEKIGHDEVEWSSSDTSVARVDDEGYVSIRKVGECYIYGTYTNEDGKEFTSRFKVVVEE